MGLEEHVMVNKPIPSLVDLDKDPDWDALLDGHLPSLLQPVKPLEFSCMEWRVVASHLIENEIMVEDPGTIPDPAGSFIKVRVVTVSTPPMAP
jgi:hypothetical protein